MEGVKVDVYGIKAFKCNIIAAAALAADQVPKRYFLIAIKWSRLQLASLNTAVWLMRRMVPRSWDLSGCKERTGLRGNIILSVTV